MTTELYHHGVKGQSWGKRNGPPYPLYRKSSYYKKTGKRPPSYTGDKKSKSDDGGPNKSGKVGGYGDYHTEKHWNPGTQSFYTREVNDNGTKKGTWSDRLEQRAMKKKEEKGRIGGLPNENAKGNNDRRSDLKRKILKGAGIAAGAAALAGAGYLAYKNRGAIASKAGSLRDNIRYRLGEMPGTAKMNATRINLKNRILNAKNAARNAGIKVRNAAAKPGQTVYNKIAGKSKAALKVAKNESQVARNNARTLKNFIDDNAKAIEKTTIAKRQALAKIRRGEGNLKELNRTANNLAVRERALIAKQNTAKTLAPQAVGERVTKAEAVRQAQAVFAKRNKLGRIAAGATNVGVGVGLLGTAGATGYGISKIANRRKQKARIQNRRKRR